MFSELRKRVKKAGEPPGTLTYTGDKKHIPPSITVITYDAQNYEEKTGSVLTDDFFPKTKSDKSITWVNLEGLHDISIIDQLAQRFNLHPLTVEDILNVEQRSKVEEFEGYIFITLKVLQQSKKAYEFSTQQLSLIVGEHFILSFQEIDTTLFDSIRTRLKSTPNQHLRKHGSDYLAYRLIDTVVDEYFFVLEGLSDAIEKAEERIIAAPTPKTARIIYRLRRQILLLRKAVWPVREAISHLLHLEGKLISAFTKVYLRDVYDHTIQAIDTLETFRDMLTSILDMYLSSLTNRMNEIMKTLTIIATIFIPITAIASIYGMNFEFMPGLHWRYSYAVMLVAMICIALVMLYYFRRNKWI